MIPKYDMHSIVAGGLKFRRHDCENALTYLIEICGGVNPLAKLINHPHPTVQHWARRGFNSNNPAATKLIILMEILKEIRDGDQAPYTPSSIRNAKYRRKSKILKDSMVKPIGEDKAQLAMNILNDLLKIHNSQSGVARAMGIKRTTVLGWYRKGGNMSRESFAMISKFHEENKNGVK